MPERFSSSINPVKSTDLGGVRFPQRPQRLTALADESILLGVLEQPELPAAHAALSSGENPIDSIKSDGQ